MGKIESKDDANGKVIPRLSGYGRRIPFKKEYLCDKKDCPLTRVYV